MTNNYAPLSDRIKASFIDSVVLIILMYASSEILNAFDNIPTYIRITLAIFIFILYDPIFTSSFGGTVGHTLSDITVKKDSNREKNINFPKALIRFLLKLTLGWISLLTVTSNENKKAIHDFIANSVVLKIE